jgi:hypothetical protein
MKNEIYNEIQKLENNSNEIYKKKGRCIRILADTISCFICIDTKKNWKNKNNISSISLDSNGNYEIVGCLNCNNTGLISYSQTNNITQNGYKIFQVNNNNWIERIEEIHNKASRDTSIIKKVNEWINNINNPNKPYNLNIQEVKPTKVEIVKAIPVKNELSVETMPLFEVCKRITKDYTEKSLNIDIEVGKIIEIVKSTIETYFGNIFSLVDLAKELRMSFYISDGKSESNDKLIKIKDNNYLGIKTYTKITQNVIRTSLFGKNKFAKVYTADIFILKPLNKKAIEKANMIMGKIGEEMTDDILKEF